MTREEIQNVIRAVVRETMNAVNHETLKASTSAIDRANKSVDTLLSEFDRLKDCERVVWCLTVGAKQRDSRLGRDEGTKTWMVQPWRCDPEEFRFCHIAEKREDDFQCTLGPNFSIAAAADPDRVRAIIDAEMAKEADRA